MEATAIVKGTKKTDAAQTLVDWSVREAAKKLYNEGYAIVAIPELAQPVPKFLPENIAEQMIENDFDVGGRPTASGSWPSGRSATTSKSEPKSYGCRAAAPGRAGVSPAGLTRGNRRAEHGPGQRQARHRPTCASST